eukprot:Seg1563.5 transcript_id=Seg1563.5/GoldUCD/mRNA.D3Y31 product="Transcription factor ets-4" protein_id=Seg1563.5/GoldUCD/D3Y31
MACKISTPPGYTLTNGLIHWFQSDANANEADANEAGTETDDDDNDDDDKSLESTINDSLFAEILQELKESDMKSYSSAETSGQEKVPISVGLSSGKTRRAAVIKRSHSADAKPFSAVRFNTFDMATAALNRSLPSTMLRSLLHQKQVLVEYLPESTGEQLHINNDTYSHSRAIDRRMNCADEDITEKDDEAPHGLASVSAMMQRCMQTPQSQWQLDSNETDETMAYETKSTNDNQSGASKVFCGAETGFNYRFQSISDENINTWEEYQQQSEKKRKLWWLSNDSVTGIKKDAGYDGPNKVRWKERNTKSLDMEDGAVTEASPHWFSVESNEQGDKRLHESEHFGDIKGSSEEMLELKETGSQEIAMKERKSDMPSSLTSSDGHVKLPRKATTQTRTNKAPIVKREPKLYLFLQKILEDPEQYSCVEWVDKSSKIFRIKNTAAIASLWGSKKNKPNMKYEHFARTLRGYIARGLLKKPRKKLVYQFNYEK